MVEEGDSFKKSVVPECLDRESDFYGERFTTGFPLSYRFDLVVDGNHIVDSQGQRSLGDSLCTALFQP